MKRVSCIASRRCTIYKTKTSALVVECEYSMFVKDPGQVWVIRTQVGRKFNHTLVSIGAQAALESVVAAYGKEIPVYADLDFTKDV